jgi:hypothetical protein
LFPRNNRVDPRAPNAVVFSRALLRLSAPAAAIFCSLTLRHSAASLLIERGVPVNDRF